MKCVVVRENQRQTHRDTNTAQFVHKVGLVSEREIRSKEAFHQEDDKRSGTCSTFKRRLQFRYLKRNK